MSVSQTPATIFTRINGSGPDISVLTQLSAAKPEFDFDEVMAQQREHKNAQRQDDAKTPDKSERSAPEVKAKERAKVEPKDTPESVKTPDAAAESKMAADNAVNEPQDDELAEAKTQEASTQEGETESETESETPEEEMLASTEDVDDEVGEGALADGAGLGPQVETREPLVEGAIAGAVAGEEEPLDGSAVAPTENQSAAVAETLVDPALSGDQTVAPAEVAVVSGAVGNQVAAARTPVREEKISDALMGDESAVDAPAAVMTASISVAATTNARATSTPLAVDSQNGFTTTNRRFGTSSPSPSSPSPSLLAEASGNLEDPNARLTGEIKSSLPLDGAADNKAQIDPKTGQAPLRTLAGVAMDLAIPLTSSDSASQVAALKEGLSTSSSTAIEGTRIAGSTLSQFQTGSVRGAQVQTSVQTPVGQQPQWGSAVAEKVLWMAAQNLTSAEIHLDPPELGPMMVRVTVSQDQVSVTFASQQVAVREALDQTAFRLREQFDEQGLNLVNVDVSDQGFGQQGNDEAGEGQDGTQSAGGDGADEERVVPVGPEIGIVDYYV